LKIAGSDIQPDPGAGRPDSLASGPPEGGHVCSPVRRPEAKRWGIGVREPMSPGRGDRGVCVQSIPPGFGSASDGPRPAPPGPVRGGTVYPGVGWQPHPGLNTIGPVRGRDRPERTHRRSCGGALAGLLQRRSMSPSIGSSSISFFFSGVLLAAILAFSSAPANAQHRVRPPEFEPGYELPTPTRPQPDSNIDEYAALAALAVALMLATYLSLKYRRRRAILVLSAVSLIYFGFVRGGCVCAVGSVQNVAMALFDGGYAMPAVVLGFFLLPLITAMLFGRAFCGAVCPLGAVQDLVALRPVQVPKWLAGALGLLAYAYLALAVLLAGTGSAFVICRYDPFVAMFRLSGETDMLILGACALVIGVFVARPYCRFFCPYGVLLGWASKLSWKPVTITPDECIQCRLCEDSCPFGAIHRATPPEGRRPRREGKKALTALLLACPLLIAAGGYLASRAAPPLAQMHPTVALAERVAMEEAGRVEDRTDASTAFRSSGRPFADLRAEAEAVGGRVEIGAWLAGGFLGLVVGVKLIALTVRRRHTDYQADRAGCLACGRCFETCPMERRRRKRRATEAVA